MTTVVSPEAAAGAQARRGGLLGKGQAGAGRGARPAGRGEARGPWWPAEFACVLRTVTGSEKFYDLVVYLNFKNLCFEKSLAVVRGVGGARAQAAVGGTTWWPWLGRGCGGGRPRPTGGRDRELLG